LEKALGQYILYKDVLAQRDPNRILYLAIPEAIWTDIFQEPLGQLLLENERLRLIVFAPEREEIVEWIS
jgi:hypothetical protein